MAKYFPELKQLVKHFVDYVYFLLCKTNMNMLKKIIQNENVSVQ